VAFLRTLGTPFIQLIPDLSPSRHVPLRNVGTPSRGETDPVQAAALVAPAVQVAGPDTSLETIEGAGAKRGYRRLPWSSAGRVLTSFGLLKEIGFYVGIV